MNFVSTIENSIVEICKHPFQYLHFENKYYEFFLKKFPFTIECKINETKEQIVLISIFHQRRNPAKKLK